MIRTLCRYLFLLFLLSINNKTFALNDTTTQTKLTLTQDSGFITFKEGLDFLLSNSLTDTTYGSSWWGVCKKQTDTIGKYYKIENSDNYIMCLIDLGSIEKYDFETHIIIEIDAKGELLKSERFLHWHSSCCWDNHYDGFSKYGDFFGIEICGTGSGFCSSRLCLFKEVMPQNSVFYIPLRIWFSSEYSFLHLYSSIEIKENELIIHYTKEAGEVQENETDDFFNIKIDYTDEFSIKYFYENGKWDTKDKSKLKELEDSF